MKQRPGYLRLVRDDEPPPSPCPTPTFPTRATAKRERPKQDVRPHPVSGAPMAVRIYVCPRCKSKRGYWMTGKHYAAAPTAPHKCACGTDRYRMSSSFGEKSLPDDMQPAFPHNRFHEGQG